MPVRPMDDRERAFRTILAEEYERRGLDGCAVILRADLPLDRWDSAKIAAMQRAFALGQETPKGQGNG